MKKGSSVLVLVAALVVASIAEAQRRKPDFHRLKEALEAVYDRLADGASPQEVRVDLNELHSGFSERVERLRTRLDRTDQAVHDLGLGAVAAERLARARAAFLESYEAVLESLDRLRKEPDLAEIESCLKVLEPLTRANPANILSAQDLPLRAPDLSPPPLEKSGITNTESFAGEAGSNAAIIGTVPGALRELAETLDGLVAVYEFVKNTTRFELYHGSMKGAEQTWREGRGNDADINALLVALFRAKGVPARFVRGVVELPIDTAMNLFGVTLPERVEQALDAAAVPYEPVFAGTGVAALELEHIWVEVYLPYSNYRGTGLDDQGRRWVPLDASFEFHTVSEGFRVLEAMDFDAEAFLQESFVDDPLVDPLESLREQVSDYLEVTQPGMTYAASLRTVEQVPEVYGLLPASLPYEVVSVNAVSYELPRELEHRVRFQARTPGGEFVLDTSFVASRLMGRRLTLSYIPAGPEDYEAAFAFGGLYQIPPFLVEVKPVLRSGGIVIAEGSPIGMGMPFLLTVAFQAPAGVIEVENRMIAGAFAAMALSGRGPTFSEATEGSAGEILSQRALNYLKRWNQADDELAGLARVVNFRPVPSHVMVKNHIEVDYATGIHIVPLEFAWKGIAVDADLRPSAPVSAEGNDSARRDFFLLSGLVGSDLENRVLEDDLGIPSISTLKLIRLSPALDIDVTEIDSGNVDEELAFVTIEPDLKAAIRTQAHLGRVVATPVSELSFLAWTGAGFVARDPSTGESAYMLSGTIAGGYTTLPPEGFPEEIRAQLEEPVEPEDPDVPGEEPGEPASIAIVPESNYQEGLVDQELERPLEVLVTDVDGNPVGDGTAVVFRALDTGSRLESADTDQQGSEIMVPTQSGVARAKFVLGTSTRKRHGFVRAKPDDQWMTQVGVYHVTASAGDVVLASPFTAIAYPDAEKDATGRHARLKYVSGRTSTNYPLQVDADPLWVETVDRFGNPLSNIDVTFVVGAPERLKGGSLPDVFTNAKIAPVTGDRDTYTGTTHAAGIFAYVRLGDVDSTQYKFTANLDDPKLGPFSESFVRESYDLGAGSLIRPIGEKIVIFLRDEGVELPSGYSLRLGKAGNRIPGTLTLTVQAYQEEFEVLANDQGKFEFRGTDRFKRRPVTDALVEPVMLDGEALFEPRVSSNGLGGEYLFKMFLGPEPGRRRFEARITATLTRPILDTESGEVSFEEFSRTRNPIGPGFDVWAVTARLLEHQPDPILLDATGHLEEGVQLAYEILPFEVEAMLGTRQGGAVERVFEDRELFAIGDLSGEGLIELESNFFYDLAKTYDVEIALLPGTDLEITSERKRLRIFNAAFVETKPTPILVERDVEGAFATTASSALSYYVGPTPIEWDGVDVRLIEIDRETSEEEQIAELSGNAVEGEGQAILPANFKVDVDLNDYRAELVLRAGDVSTTMDMLPNPFSRLLYDVSPFVRLRFEYDPVNQRSCFVPAPITYYLDEAADVFIATTVDDVEHTLFLGEQAPSAESKRFELKLEDSEVFPSRSGEYEFRILAQAKSGGLVEQFKGKILVEFGAGNVLPVGHTFIKGVDLQDGHLVASSTDVRIPGRGPALEVARTYSSDVSSEDGPLGAGWTMNYFSTLIITDCFWMIRGGDGSGQRFVEDGDEFIPQKGYHTKLVRNDDGSYDFFTKGHVRYHYHDHEIFEGDNLYAGRPTLEYIKDPNGNRIQLFYDGERNIIEAREVYADETVGRSLHFGYETVFGRPRLNLVTGPLGLEITYEYDRWANLEKVTRNERVEQYRYDVANYLDRHNMEIYTDPNGNTTKYIYYEEEDLFPGETGDPLSKGKFEWVKEVQEPEGVTTTFLYDLTDLQSEAEYITHVTDARGYTTTYRMNLNGSPVEISEPDDVVTIMTWAANDIYKKSETDAEGRETLFEYDSNANLITETVNAGEELGEVITVFKYDPKYNKMTYKKDAEGNETFFDIDPDTGNLRWVEDAEGNFTHFRYNQLGDLTLQTGPRPGQLTVITYDALGNPETTTDSLQNVTTTYYDERSRLRSSEDTSGRSMSQTYDDLDRVTEVARTDTKGSSVAEVIKRDYYRGGQLKRETNGLDFWTYFTLDDLNRVVGILDSLGLTTTMRYDGNGNVIEKVDRRQVTTIYTYDFLNRLVKVELRGGKVVSQFDYDKVGNKLFETDVHDHRTDFEYDGLYRMKKRILPLKPYVELFTYDKVGNKRSETDANEKTTEFFYDKLNRLIHRFDPEDNHVQFDYDEAGNQTLEEDLTRGLKTATKYDLLNRPNYREVSSSPDNFLYPTSFLYDDQAHTVIETDARGYSRTTQLDGFDRVHRVSQETGEEVLVTTNYYDGNGNLKAVLDAKQQRTDYIYDGLNRLKEIQYPLGLPSKFDYDGEGNKIEEIDRRGIKTAFSYDPLGRLETTTVDPTVTGVSSSTRISYDDLHNRRIEYDARNFATTFVKDDLDRVESIIDPNGKTQVFDYDGVNKRVEFDKRGFPTHFEYDGINRLNKVIDAKLEELTTKYLDSARQVVETDRRNIDKTTQLDALGRLVSVTRAGVLLEQHQYDSENNRTLSIDANGNKTKFVYDGANRLTSRIDGFESPDATTTFFTYDPVGNLLTEKDGRNTGKLFDINNTYDKLNRLIAVEEGEGNITQFEYDGEGNRTAMIEPELQRTEFDYGELNELIEVRMEDGGVFKYEYDPNRNRIKQTDAENNVVKFTYDNLNRLDLMIQDPDGLHLVTDHDYDANGNETKLTDPKDQVINFEYDELNRLKSKVYNLTPNDFAIYTRTHRIDYSYDENDNLEQVDELRSSGTDPPAVSSNFKDYDDLDRLIFESDTFGRTLNYGYDPQGNRTSLIDPDQKETTYGYDDLNRLKTITTEAGTTTYTYFPDGLKETVSNPNDTTSTFGYDAADRMTSIEHLGPSGTVSAFAYDYTPNGNRLSQVETNAGTTQTTTYTYDEVNRLETVTYEEGTPNARTTTYQYDLAGNRISEQEIEVETANVLKDLTYSYDEINRLEAITDNIGGDDVAYAYDANGNTISKAKAGVTTTFKYDIRDQLGEVQQGTDILGRYGYDYEGRRILKIGADGRRHYTYDELSVITEADETNATVSKYDYGLDQLVSLNSQIEGRSFFHLDALRSTVNLTDGFGGTRQSILYDAWGNERDRIGTSANKFTFTGHELDEETGLIYAKARFFDPDVGRFLSQDAVLGDVDNPPSLHRYTYAYSNPGKYVDRDGNSATVVGAAAGFMWGFGQMIGGMVDDVVTGDVKTTGDYLSLWAQNTIAGAEIGAAIDVGMINPAAAGALMGAGVSGLTLTGEAAGWGEYAKGQIHGAGIGAAVGVAPQLAVPLAAYGAYTGVQEIRQGAPEVGLFHLGVSTLPFASKTVRNTTLTTRLPGRTSQPRVSAQPRNGPKASTVAEAPNAGMPTTKPVIKPRTAPPPQARESVSSAQSPRAPPPSRTSAGERGFKIGEPLPGGRVAGEGPGAALRNGPEFAGEPRLLPAGKQPKLLPAPRGQLPSLREGYHYRHVGGKTFVSRNPGRAADLPPMHLESGKLLAGLRPGQRNPSARSAFLKQLAASGRAPKWMNQWLMQGNVPQGHQVDHIVPLSIGGKDVPANMRLLDKAFHDLHHSPGHYRPWEY